MWDAVMNYLFTRACVAFFIGDRTSMSPSFARPSSIPPANRAPRRSPAPSNALLKLYHPNVTSVMLNLLDSHDMARFLTLARGDKSALRLATLFQMTYPGAPSIYYGDEIGLAGGHDPAQPQGLPLGRSDAGTPTCSTTSSR